ncbi:tautomerase family protein [Clostridium sp. WILCCON 0269]|uniref:Tautomerase family protein n=1 Tax=Candidatus Clostridium eludens TaxID=3381663 RepID=A0ABW8SSH3_9CLOT
MSQIKVYGLKDNLNNIKEKLSEVIHSCVVDAFQMPEDKRFHRFFPLDRENFYFQSNRTEKYIIIEISIFEGRTTEAKKKLIRLLFQRIQEELNIMPNDIEITIFETPSYNWGIRGLPGDELSLDYNIKI